MDKPIPAYYACYLLRSTVRHQALYIGSTPHPIRRLKQHNGELIGGATKTSRDSARPWEMTCLVSGFPSKISALQFEWAWQNTHLTRHVAPDSRSIKAQPSVRFSPKTGRIRKQRSRPSLGLNDRLTNLHLLLRSNSFERWPLKVTFYAEDVFRAWTRRMKQQLHTLRAGIEILLDDSRHSLPPGKEETCQSTLRVQSIDVGYGSYKGVVEKRKHLLDTASSNKCGLCDAGLSVGDDLSLICPESGCGGLFHLDCLASTFLPMRNTTDALIPLSGQCPKCTATLQWADLVKELSLSIRGHRETEKLFKKSRTRRPNDETTNDAENELSEEDEEMEDVVAVENLDQEVWHYISDENDEEASLPADETENAPIRSSSTTLRRTWQNQKYTVEDSDWDEAEVLT